MKHVLGPVLLCLAAMAVGWWLFRPQPPATTPGPQARQVAPGLRFRHATAGSGIAFVHDNGARGARWIYETLGSGACWLDYDGDGDPDLYLVQSGPVPESRADLAALPPLSGDKLYENLGGGRFRDVTAAAGLGDTGYGMGAVAADHDGDGDPDLFVTRVGTDLLYENLGDGRFRDVTERAGVGGPAGPGNWSVSACFLDADTDGDLDLYVTAYLTVDGPRLCYNGGYLSYCGPQDYPPASNRLYVNQGDGRYLEAGPEAGVEVRPPGISLGVVACDLDGDGRTDLYVANDTDYNFLFLNRSEPGGPPRFEDAAEVSGCALGAEGKPEAGMGTAVADLDGDGLPDLLVANFQREPDNAYRNLGGGAAGGCFFVDMAEAWGLADATRLRLGFGLAAVDLNADGRDEVVRANGHIFDNVALYDQTATFAQHNQVFYRTDAYRTGAPARSGDGPGKEPPAPRFSAADLPSPGGARVSRGLALADVDGDGDVDVLIANNNAAPDLLLNESPQGAWVGLRLRGRGGNTGGLGARVRVTAGGRTHTRWLSSGGSYLSGHEPRLHFGLGLVPQDAGSAAPVRFDLEVRWPSGLVDRHAGLEAGRDYEVPEGGEVR